MAKRDKKTIGDAGGFPARPPGFPARPPGFPARPPGFPVWRTVINVVIVIFPPIVGFWGLFDFWGGSVAAVYFGGVLLYVLIIGPWMVCTHCSYFDRSCPLGMGKVSAAMYSYGSGNVETGGRINTLFWVLWYTIFPVVVFLYFMKTEFTADKALYLAVFAGGIVLFWLWSFTVGRVKYERRVCDILPLRRKKDER